MNILIINRDLAVGGGVTYIRGLSQILRERGHRVVVIAAPGPMASLVAGSCDRLYQVPLVHRLQVPWLRGFTKKHAIDIVNVHARTPARVAAPVCTSAGIPLIVTAHGPVAERALRDLRGIYTAAEAVVVMNEQNYRYYHELGVRAERLLLTWLLIHWPDTAPRPARPARVFAYCSRLSGHKGPRAEVWLQAMALLPPDPERTLIVFGGGHYESRLKKTAGELGLNVRFEGAIADAASRFGGVDVVTGAGYVAVEALRAGCAVVGAGFDGFFGAVTPEKLGDATAVNFGDNAYRPLDTTPLRVAEQIRIAAAGLETGSAAEVARRARAEFGLEAIREPMGDFYERVLRGEDFRTLSLIARTPETIQEL